MLLNLALIAIALDVSAGDMSAADRDCRSRLRRRSLGLEASMGAVGPSKRARDLLRRSG